MRLPTRMLCLALLLLGWGWPLRADKVLVNRSGVPLRLLVTRIQAGGAMLMLAIHPDADDLREISYQDTFSGNHERSILPLPLPPGGMVVFSGLRKPSAPTAIQEFMFRIAPAEGDTTELAGNFEGLWATYGLAPVAGETLTEHGSNEINNSLWEIKAPDLDDPTYRIVPRGSGWRLPCVIF